jgi:hypothetical protein
MKKLILILIGLSFISCGVQKKIIQDPYVGIYVMTIFDVDEFGDIPITLTINKEAPSYTTKIEMRGEAAANSEYTWEIDSTEIENETISIEAYVASYDVYFELGLDEDEISGSLMGMYEVKGKRITPKQ